MRTCLLAHHSDNHACRRLREELSSMGECTVLHPHEVRWSWPQPDRPTFDVTFNRLSPVESGPFERALGKLPMWGRQVNPWELREELWDKAHQAIWLAKRGLEAVPSFMHRGGLTAQDPHWLSFKQQHAPDGWVLKFNRGQRGVGVHFFSDEAELMAWLETLRRMGDQDFLVQPWIKAERELRLTLLDGRPWALLEREGVRANFAQGATAHEIPWAQAPSAVKELADKLSLPGTALAVDFWLDDGVRVLDVNTVPGVEQLEMVTGRNFTGELVKMGVVPQN